MAILYIFDFDDTLVDSDAEIRIRHADGELSTMTSEEYAKYSEQPGDEFDFSDFDSYPKNPEIIEPVFAELRSAIATQGSENVVILTARSNPVPVRSFFDANNIGSVEIVTVGTSDPSAKALYILGRVKNENHEEVVVFEDNVRNIRRIRKVLTDEGIRLQTNRVVNGRIVDIRSESRRRRGSRK